MHACSPVRVPACHCQKHAMRLATLLIDGHEIIAHISPDGGRYWPVRDRNGRSPASMIALIRQLDEAPGSVAAEQDGEGHSAERAITRAPIVLRRNIMCVGKTYRAHAREFTRSKFDSSAADDADAIPSARTNGRSARPDQSLLPSRQATAASSPKKSHLERYPINGLLTPCSYRYSRLTGSVIASNAGSVIARRGKS